MTWLSILVPVYNVHLYLEECLESIVNQIDAGVEVLVLDDCSTDGSWELLQRLAERWPAKLQILRHQQNSGLSAARNTMIDSARGDYLWFVDSDDKILPGAVNTLSHIVQDGSPDIVLCDFTVWREKTKLKHRFRDEAHRHTFRGISNQCIKDRAQLLTGIFSTGQMHAWSKISKRTLWGASIRFPHGRYFEDSMCMPLLMLRSQSFFYCSQPWVAYRQRSSSILSTMNVQKVQDLSESLCGFSQELSNDSLSEDISLKELVAIQCSRNLLGAMRFIKKNKNLLTSDQYQSLAKKFMLDFDKSSSYSIPELVKFHLSRGNFLRAMKLYALKS